VQTGGFLSLGNPLSGLQSAADSLKDGISNGVEQAKGATENLLEQNKVRTWYQHCTLWSKINPQNITSNFLFQISDVVSNIGLPSIDENKVYP